MAIRMALEISLAMRSRLETNYGGAEGAGFAFGAFILSVAVLEVKREEK